MPIVTLQVPIRLCDRALWLFTRTETSLPLDPVAGLLLSGWGVPDTLINAPLIPQGGTIVRSVVVDGTHGVIVNCQGTDEPTYNREEMLAMLRQNDSEQLLDSSPGWEVTVDPFMPSPRQENAP